VLSNVLVATNFSEGASWAIVRACLLPLARAAKLLLLHVIPDTLTSELRREAEVKAYNDLQSAAASAAQATLVGDLVVETEILVGKPFAEIVRRARQIGAELTVIGRRGHTRARDFFIRSTVTRVIRNGDVPVLVVSRKPMLPYRHPLLAVDVENASPRIVEVVAQLLGTDVKAVPVVHACRVPFEGWIRPSLTPAEMNSYRQAFREQASAQFINLIRSWGGLRFQLKAVTREGDARSVILREISRRRSDLVALGTHDRSGLSRAVLGSVAETIVEAAPCDVLVARPTGFTSEHRLAVREQTRRLF